MMAASSRTTCRYLRFTGQQYIEDVLRIGKIRAGGANYGTAERKSASDN
jgi:hypothetical protein